MAYREECYLPLNTAFNTMTFLLCDMQMVGGNLYVSNLCCVVALERFSLPGYRQAIYQPQCSVL